MAGEPRLPHQRLVPPLRGPLGSQQRYVTAQAGHRTGKRSVFVRYDSVLLYVRYLFGNNRKLTALEWRRPRSATREKQEIGKHNQGKVKLAKSGQNTSKNCKFLQKSAKSEQKP